MDHQHQFICSLAAELRNYYISVIMLQRAPDMLDAHTRAVANMVDRIALRMQDMVICDEVMSAGVNRGPIQITLSSVRNAAAAMIGLSEKRIRSIAEHTLLFELHNPEVTDMTLEEPLEVYKDFWGEFDKAYNAVRACCEHVQ